MLEETPQITQTPAGSPASFRVLSLDGGGAKGVYTLGVLRELEAYCNRPLCEVFDLIYGTSTGSIIAAMIALGYRIPEIEALYFKLVPGIMQPFTAAGRTAALKKEARALFEEKTFSDFKTNIGIVCTNHGFERPMVFKRSVTQAHGRHATFKPGFGCTIAEAVAASCSAYPFFEMVSVKTENQGEQLLMDGGYVANNPTLFALADARNAFEKGNEEIAVLSVGVGSFNEPNRTVFHRAIFSWWPFRHLAKMFNISSKTIEQLRVVLFPKVACVRVSESYNNPEYATDLLESDPKKLEMLNSLGRESFGLHEAAIRSLLGF